MLGMVRGGEGALFCEVPFVSVGFDESFVLGSEGCGVVDFPTPLRAGSTGPCSGMEAALCEIW